VSEDPRSVAHFRVVARLGAGAMGVVYKAIDEKLGRAVALKVLPDALAGDDDRRRRFLREARSAAAVTHPNLATIYEAGEDGGRVYIAMEHVSGRTLREILAAGALPVAEALEVARGILRGIARAHDAGIVHRDLKPENVMVDEERQVKVLDFGLAKLREPEGAQAGSAVERAETLTRPGGLLGTPGYMAPEQIEGTAVDARTDLFAVGVILYEVIAGERPFTGKRLVDVLAATSKDAPTPLSDRNAAVGPEITRVVERCLAKSPEDRHPSARAMLEALEGLGPRADAAAAIATESALSRPAVPQRSWARVAALAGAVVAVAAVAVLLVRARTDPTAAPAPTAATPSASTAKSALAITGHPAPRTRSPDAAAAYVAALQDVRDASMGLAYDQLRHAVQLDPTFAAAWLRLAIFTFWEGTSTTLAREAYSTALQYRTALDERDLELLKVADSRTTDPVDWAEIAARAARALERFPDDAELLYVRADALDAAGRSDEARAAAVRAVEVDPQFAGALRVLALSYYFTDYEAQLRTVERCLQVSPSAATCLFMRGWLDRDHGRCAEFEADSRAQAAAEPRGPLAFERLAAALAARGAAADGVRGALEKRAELAVAADDRPQTRAIAAAQTEAWMALLGGDFITAEAGVREWERQNAGLTDESLHAEPTEALIEIAVEEGDAHKALGVAEAFERRVPAWTPDAPWGPRMRLAYARHRAGALSDDAFRRERDRLEGETLARSPGYWGEWTHADQRSYYAETRAEAGDAVAAIEEQKHPVTLDAVTRGDFGKAYLLAGHVDKAIPHLRYAAASCLLLQMSHDNLPTTTFFAMRTHARLGQALEAKGDKPGACEAYAFVVDHWKNAKPRSVTLELARSRSAALGCGR
jgi:serine/threonine-protein kinase